MKKIMEAFRKNVLSEESAEKRAKTRAEKMYDLGYNAGLSGEGKSQKNTLRYDQDYTDGYSDGVGVRRGEDGRSHRYSKKTNEVQGSTAGEGMPLERAFKHAMKYAVSKGLNLGYAQKVRLKDWVRDSVANKNMSDPDGKKAIEAAINSKEAYR